MTNDLFSDLKEFYQSEHKTPGVFEALANRYSQGDWVNTPDGDGMVDEPVTEGTVDDMDASDSSPVYPVVMLDEETVNFYKASDLQATDEPEADVDSPESDLEALFDIRHAVGFEALQDGFFTWPESWQDSETPARVIAMKAWSGMGGSWRGCRREMRGNITSPERFCSDFKDRLYGTEQWRGGWAD